MQRRYAIIGLAILVALTCAGAVLWPIIVESYEKPDWAKMRAYRMSRLTDAQLLELHKRAIEESANQKTIADDQDKTFWAERSKASAECEANPATKLRDPDHCNPPIPLGMLSGGNQVFVVSPGDLFEQYVMGSCLMVRSVREARKYNCLP